MDPLTIVHAVSGVEFEGRELVPGDMLRFDGAVGQFEFKQAGWHVDRPEIIWIDCVHPKQGGLRSFNLSDLKKVRRPRKKK